MDADHSRERSGVLFHVSPSVNQEAILEHGLDVSRMGAAHGIAGSTEPESTGTHLVDGGVDEALWYASFGHHPRVEIWQVDADGLQVEETEDGWLCREVISPARLTLLESGVTPDQAEMRAGFSSGWGSRRRRRQFL